MQVPTKLILIKILHSMVWLFFNIVIFYMLYAIIINRIDWRIWAGYGLIAAEGAVLLVFRNVCPITMAARNYSSSNKANFDIFLPNWLARYNKIIYTVLVVVVVLIHLYQLLK